MSNNEPLKYLFIDNDNNITHELLFESYDIELLEQVKNHYGSKMYISRLDYPKAGVGGDFYNGQAYPEKPYPSWIRNEELISWDPPIEYPALNEGTPKYYIWNEDIVNWEEIQVSE